ncbi:ArsR/SmtB family transcription factor [Acidicapsa dinghuensis]|uniref:ArsR/SmtB family transcription factor n=1 Tax=Acidicapsa dinghuensis TaxID=2218256 RepID=A0ABW1EAQ8_9BACT
MHQPAELFRALADPTRLAVFESLAAAELSVSELTAKFDVSQPAISQHLAALRSSGLVRPRKAGRQIFYSADPAGMQPIFSWIAHYQAFWTEKLPHLEALLKQLPEAPPSQGEDL